MVSTHVVPLQGAVLDWVIQQCARDLERLGHYGQVTLKSDQDPAIVDVLREIANLRGSRGSLLEHSLAADSQSNGFIERGRTRVILFDLSLRLGSPISVHSPVFPWIVDHATDILNKCHVASDGKSSYERMKRRQHRGMLLPSGTAVMFRVARKVPGGVITERWHLGTWLGKPFPYRRTHRGTKGRRSFDQIVAVKVTLEETTWTRSRGLRGAPLVF